MIKILFLCISLLSFSFASSSSNTDIANISAKPLFELDKDGLDKVLIPYIKNSKAISSVNITDLSYDEIYWSYPLGKPGLNCNSDELKQSTFIFFENEKIGKVDVCYKKELFKATKDLVFTQEEKQWLNNNPVIKVAYMSHFTKDIYDKNIHIDYANLLSRFGEVNLSLVNYDNWNKALEDVTLGEEVQGVLDLSWSKKREDNNFDYIEPYFYTPLYILVKNSDNKINNIEDLKDKSVYLEKGSISNEIINQLNLNITPIVLKNNQEMIENLSEPNSSGDAVLTYLLDENLLEKYDLKVANKFYNKYGQVYLGVTKKYSLLKSILTKAHNKIPKSELEFIQNKVYKFEKDSSLKLSSKEKKWIENNKTVTFVGHPLRMPFEGFDEKNNYIGFVSEYLKIFEEKTGINIDIIQTNNWDESLSLVQEGNIDLFSDDIFENDTRVNEQYKAVKSYLSNDIVIVMGEDASYIDDLNLLKDKKIAVIKKYAYVNELYKKYPALNFTEVHNVQEALSGLSSQKFDAILGSVGLMSYSIKNLGYYNLRIVGSTNLKMKLTFFIKKDKEHLFNIFTRFSDSLSPLDHLEIKNKYTQVEFETVVDYTIIWYIIFIGLALLTIVGLINRRLQFLVEEKTLELKELNKSLEQKVKNRTKELTEEKNHVENLNDELKEEKNNIDKLNKELNIAKEKAENVSKQKSEFLANMSHEIRTPMNSVIGFTEILEKELSDPVHRDYLSSIKKGGISLLRIINDILDLSKIEAGKLEIKNESINPKSLFLEIESIFHSKIIAKNISFKLDIDKTLPQYIILDGVRLRQILFNLIGNAIKFTEQGFIKVKVENIYKDNIKSKVDLIFSVEDTGLGIEEKSLKNIFKAFEQQDNQDVSKYGGTGLGLAICTKLVKMMNGKIAVESEKNKGSKFTVELHDIAVGALAQEESTSKVSLSSVEFENASILVVDDIEENRKLVKAALKDFNFNLIMAENGQEAIDRLKNINVDLIFMDLRMPVMDGYEAVSIIKEDNKLSKIPVIALTASVMGKDLEKVSQYGFDGYLRKPVIFEDLLEEMCKYLDYNIKTSEPLQIKDDNININDLSEVITILESQMKEEWKTLKDSGDFTLIEEFSIKLKDLALDKKVKLLENYADELMKNINSFDIEKIDFLLNSYLELIDDLRKKV